MALMEISIIPLGTQTASVSLFVAEAIDILEEEKNIKYQLTPMGTIIEASSIEKLLSIAGKMHSIPFENEVKRVVTTIKLDDRKDKELTMEGKVISVEEKLENKNI
jgi:uncharacterized protein (TIGR00106 family)